MAVTQNSFAGRTRGSIAGTTYSKWKDKNTARSKPLTVANPQTPKQVQRRAMMAFVVAIGRRIKVALDLGFVAYKNTMSQFNKFVQTNLGLSVIADLAPDYTFQPAQLIISKGTLSNTVISSVSGTDGSANVVVAWPTTLTAPDLAATDRANLVVFNGTQEVWGVAASAAARSAGTYTLAMPSASATGDRLHAYLFFTPLVGGSSSDSQYDYVIV